MVAHLEDVAEHVLRAGGRARALHVLHREAAEHQALHELAHRLGLHRRHALGVGERIGQAVLHGVPRAVVPFARAELVGEDPVRARRHLREQVGEAARGHPLRRGAHHVQVGHDGARRGAGVGLLRAFRRTDRRPEARVAVHARGRGAHEVRHLQVAGGELHQVVHHAGTGRHRHEVALLRACRRQRLAHLHRVMVVRMEHLAVRLQDVTFRGDAGRRQQCARLLASRLPRARVSHHQRARRRRKVLPHEGRCLAQDILADHTCLRVAGRLQRFFQSRHFVLLGWRTLYHKEACANGLAG